MSIQYEQLILAYIFYFLILKKYRLSVLRQNNYTNSPKMCGGMQNENKVIKIKGLEN